MPGSPYTSRLPGEEIRLISFANEDKDNKTSRDHNENDDKSPVSCNLTRFSLDDTRQESFNALSYCWGDPNLRKPILVNGKSLTVTEQLDQALHRLRELCPNRQIWADALCINQEDNAEKNIQVPLMATIYRNAEHVYIWLGPSNEILDEFVVFMRNEEMKKDDPKNLDRYVAFSMAFFYQSWWSRTWTFQEFMLASRPIFLLGTHIIPFAEMRIWVFWLTRVWWLTTRQGLQMAGPNPDGTTTWEEVMLAPSDLRYLVEAAKLFGDNYAAMLHRWPKSNLFAVMAFILSEKQQRNETLLHLLLVTGGQELSDPRDRIYALYNLLPVEEQANIHVDYNEKEWQVYHRTIRSMWVSWKTQYLTLMDVFQIGEESSQSDPETPSWVVNFAAHRMELEHVFPKLMAKTPWHGALSILELSPDGLALSMLATRFCKIRMVQGIGAGVNIGSEEYCKQLKAIMETLVTARIRKCDPTSRLASVEGLRKREWPLQLLCRNPKSPDAMTRLAGVLGISKAQLGLMGLYVELEIMRRSATDLAQLLIKRDRDSALTSLDRTLKVILETIIYQSRQPFYFVTKEGLYGLSKAGPAENDCIVLPRGSKMFLILRPVFRANGAAGKQYYRVVGPCYVAGLMDFEELAEVMDEEAKREEVLEVI